MATQKKPVDVPVFPKAPRRTGAGHIGKNDMMKVDLTNPTRVSQRGGQSLLAIPSTSGGKEGL